MYIPKIIFKYAYPFDQNRRKLYQEKGLGEYPSIEEVKKQVEEYKNTWAEYNQDDKIIKRMLELLGLSYSRDIEAFVFGAGMNPMSAPLLIPTVRKSGANTGERFVEILAHELIHIFVSNIEENPKLGTFWREIRNRYKDESVLVQNHLIVYAVLEIVLAEIFGQDKMRELIKTEDKEYQRSIELADEIGPQNIIDEFEKLTS